MTATERQQYTEIGNAELKVDCYSGKTCDKHKPEWHGFFEGDRDGGKIGGVITLSAKHFRPGTRIRIEEPVCPDCDCGRELCEVSKDCDFDWKAWDERRYS